MNEYAKLPLTGKKANWDDLNNKWMDEWMNEL